MRNEQATEIVVGILRSLMGEMVHDKASLSITAEGTPLAVQIRVDCDPKDAGRIIGEGGSRFRAFGHLCRLMGNRLGGYFKLNSLDVERSTVRDRLPGFEVDPGWPKATISAMLVALARAVFEYDDAIQVDVTDLNETMSDLRLTLSRFEKSETISIFSDACNLIFPAIGNHSGRKLRVSVNDQSRPTVAAFHKTWASG